MEYESIILKRRDHSQKKFYTIHYFEYMKKLLSFREKPMISGSSSAWTRAKIKVLDHILKAGQVIFHKPNEFHNLAATGSQRPPTWWWFPLPALPRP